MTIQKAGGRFIEISIAGISFLVQLGGIFLSDLGRARRLDQILENEPVIGIMGHVAPEIIQGQNTPKPLIFIISE